MKRASFLVAKDGCLWAATDLLRYTYRRADDGTTCQVGAMKIPG